MKVSKIPGLGRFGIFIDDVDFAKLTDEEWMEIGRMHLESLVTILRNVRLDHIDYVAWMQKWGTPRNTNEYTLCKKYRTTVLGLIAAADDPDFPMDAQDRQWAKTVFGMSVRDSNGQLTPMLPVTGKKRDDGAPLGMFAEGELLWHSNESGTLTHSPAVSLLGAEGMVGSATGFLTTTDWYESQSESFRSELDDMVVIHNFTPGKINPGLRAEQDLVMYKNMCPVDGSRIPLVIQSPGGIKGLHYSVNTIAQIEGMSREESDQLFARINRELFTEAFIYDHWYANNNDLCLFDNSITLHRRLGGITNRLAYRIQYDYSRLQSRPYQPYFQPEFQHRYNRQITDIVTVLGIPDFKLPKLGMIDQMRYLMGMM